MDKSRRQLLSSAGGGALALALASCGGGGYSSPAPSPMISPPPAPTPPPPPGALTCGAVSISANHGHALAIPAADLDSTTNKTYSIRGAADHDHLITLTPAQLASMKSMNAVVVQSTIDTSALYGTHLHDVTTNCG